LAYRSQSPEEPGILASGCIDFSAFPQNLVIDKAKIVLVLFKICRRSDKDVNRHRESEQPLMEILSCPPTVDAFGHYYQYVKVTVRPHVPSGSRAE